LGKKYTGKKYREKQYLHFCQDSYKNFLEERRDKIKILLKYLEDTKLNKDVILKMLSCPSLHYNKRLHKIITGPVYKPINARSGAHIYKMVQKTAHPSLHTHPFHSDVVNNNKYVINSGFAGILR